MSNTFTKSEMTTLEIIVTEELLFVFASHYATTH
jgi:hypothetical protein